MQESDGAGFKSSGYVRHENPKSLSVVRYAEVRYREADMLE
jgi:hypothetical protein